MKDDTRLALLEQSIGHINETMLRMEKRFDQVDKKFDSVEKRFDKVDERFNKVDEGFNKVDKRFDKVEGDIKELRNVTWSYFKWLMGTLLGFIATLVTIFLKGHIS